MSKRDGLDVLGDVSERLFAMVLEQMNSMRWRLNTAEISESERFYLEHRLECMARDYKRASNMLSRGAKGDYSD